MQKVQQTVKFKMASKEAAETASLAFLVSGFTVRLEIEVNERPETTYGFESARQEFYLVVEGRITISES